MVGYNKLGNILQALVLPLENYDKTKSYSYKNRIDKLEFFFLLLILEREEGREKNIDMREKH